MKKYFIKTYGCQMNYSDTERVKPCRTSRERSENGKNSRHYVFQHLFGAAESGS